MRSSLKIAKIFGIDVRVHWSLFIILLLLFGYFYNSGKPFGFLELKDPERSFYSVLASVFVLVAVLLHELGHSVVAMNFGIRVREILLFIFGGIAMMEQIPKNPKQEFLISIAGPLVSFFVAIVSFIFSYLTFGGLSTFFSISAYFNVVVAVFNLIPAFPMDGGRVLRSILAKRMSYVSATRISANIGKAIAVFMAIFGFFYNIWLLLIALFIYLGATEEEKIVTAENILSRFRIRDIMTSNVLFVDPETTVEEVIELMFKHKHLGYPVIKDGELVGIVTLKDLMAAEKNMKVRDVMSRDVITLEPEQSAFDAFKLMSEKNIGRIPIVENGKLVGIVTRSDLMKLREIIELLEVPGWKRSS